MTTFSITKALMDNYASITLLVGNFYGGTYLDNQFSLKTDVSQLTELVTTGYLTMEYINSVDLSTYCYNEAETANMLLSYSTGSYVGYNFYTN